MPNISARHIEFIRLIAKGVSQQEAYTLTSTNKSLTKQTARVEGSKLASRYALEIQQAKETDAKAVSDANKVKEAETALKSIVEQARADAKAFRILGDDDIVEDIISVGGKVQIVKRKPTQAEIQKAYDLYCKRFGSYQPTKIAATNKDGEDVPPTPQIVVYNSGPPMASNENEIEE